MDGRRYVTGGNWPASNNSKAIARANGKRHITQRLVIDTTTGKYERVEAGTYSHVDDDTTYNAVIVKTTDAGKTWTVQKKDSGNYYYNEVSCCCLATCVCVCVLSLIHI